jgi:hypothetical protein
VKSPAVARNQGFLILRRVVSVTASDFPLHGEQQSMDQCYQCVTEELHPIELFESFEIKSEIDHLYQTNFIPMERDKEEREDEFNKVDPLGTSRSSINDINMMSSLVPCTDGSYWDGYYYRMEDDDYTTNVDMVLRYDYTWTCFETSIYAPGSFNFNYDFSKGIAVKSPLPIAGVTGMTCTNCYAFMGAYFTVQVQYTYSYGFAAQASISGGAGANIGLSIVNPTVSGSITSTVISPSDTYALKLPIAKGMI